MDIEQFVSGVMQVPISVGGYRYICKAVKYVVEHDGSSKFYRALVEETGESFKTFERSMRYAKEKALKNMLELDYKAIYPSHKKSLTMTEFICYAAFYYRQHYMNKGESYENKTE